MRTARAFAPATVANVCVGFDVLGFAFGAIGDEVTVSHQDDGRPVRVELESIEGSDRLPNDPARNTATVALRAMADALGLTGRFAVTLHKRIPLGSGMGGSAASAVGAVVAAAALVEPTPTLELLLGCALDGEAAASGARHPDNAAPCLYGGLTAVLPGTDVIQLPVPAGIRCVLVHPDLRRDTREERAVLAPQVPLARHVEQSAHSMGFVAACFRGDLELLQRSFRDVVIEPQRGPRLPGFDEARAAARAAGALGCSLSGSGPSIFAWCTEADAERVRAATAGVFADRRIATRSWSEPVGGDGARIIE